MEIWIPFLLAASLILIIPGPTIILVITQSVVHGKRSVIPLAAGVMAGDFTAMTLSLLGLGAVMSASAAVFTAFKWIGAIYLFYLGIKLFRAMPGHYSDSMHETELKPAKSLFQSSFIVTALNPKSIAFFVAFLPQFINPADRVFSQLIILGGTFLSLATVNAAVYSIFASQLKEHIKRKNVQKWLNRCGGSALIGAGVVTAAIKQTA